MKPEETKGTARQNDNTLIKVLTFTVDKTMELTKSNSVLGEPVTVGRGMLDYDSLMKGIGMIRE